MKKECIEEAAVELFGVPRVGQAFARAYKVGKKNDKINFLDMLREHGGYRGASARAVKSQRKKEIGDFLCERGESISLDFIQRIEFLARQIEASEIALSETMDLAMVMSSVEADQRMTYDDIMEILRGDRRKKFEYPKQAKIFELDYESKGVQLVKIHNGNTPSIKPLYLWHGYKCSRDDGHHTKTRNTLRKGTKCFIDETCEGVLNPCKKGKEWRKCYVTIVSADGNSFPVISIEPIPQGNSIAIATLEDTEDGFWLFAVGFKKESKKSVDIDFKDHTHRLLQIVDSIDENCKRNMPHAHHIKGLDILKMAAVLTVFASMNGYTLYNTAVIGDQGTGKTTLAKYVMYSALPWEKCKTQRADGVSDPGIRGSRKQVQIGNQKVMIHEDGLFARCHTVLMDEINDIDDNMRKRMKQILGDPSLSVEIDGYRENVPKRSTCFLTGNPTKSTIQKAEDEKVFQDRIALLYYLNADKSVGMRHFRSPTLPDEDLSHKLYLPQLYDYLAECAKIPVIFSEEDYRLIEDLCTRLKERTQDIHSESRLFKYLSDTLEMLIKLDGRTESKEEDFLILEDLFKLTCIRKRVKAFEYEHEVHGLAVEKKTIPKEGREIELEDIDYEDEPIMYNPDWIDPELEEQQ